MNKLIFTEGGQPVYLEDLELLQDNIVELVRSLFAVTAGASSTASDDEGYKDVRKLPVYATARHENANGDANCVTVQAHKLITQDGIYDVEETTISESDTESGNARLSECYYVLSEESTDKREFEDGATRTVWKNYTAKITGKKPTSGTYYAVADVPSFDGLLATLRATSTGITK